MKKAAKLRRTPTRMMPMVARSGHTAGMLATTAIHVHAPLERTALDDVGQAAGGAGGGYAGPAATIRAAMTTTCAVVIATLHLAALYQLGSIVIITFVGDPEMTEHLNLYIQV